MCRSVLLSCLLLLPASLAAQLPLPKEAWFDRFGRQRGMLLLVGPQAGWLQRLHDPAQEDLLAELSIEQTSPLDPALAAFGIPGAGAYLFNEAGRLLKSWPSGAPSDLRAALAEAGWISRSESLELALKDHRQRLDLLARLFQTQWRRAHQRPAPENLG